MESNWKFQRGDIYFVKLEAGVGSEQNGARPAVILQNDVGNIYSPTLIVAALTSKTDKKVTQATHCQVEEDGLKPSIVQAEQIFTIDKSRVLKFVGHLSPENMRRVDDAVKISLALNPMGSIQKLKPIIRSQAAYAPPEVVDGGSHLESNWKFQRGDIYFVKLEAGVGSEQNGARPAVILQNDVGNIYSPTLIVAALTSKTDKKVTQATHCQVEEDGLKPSIVQTEQIFTIDKSRVLKFIGHLSPENMRRVDDAVKISLALNPMGSIQKLKPIIRSRAAYAPPEVVDGKPPIYPYTPIKSSFEDAGSVEEMMMYTELQSAVHAMIQRLEYSFTFNPTLLTIPKRKQQVAEILEEAEKYIWRIKEEMRCA